MGLSNKEDDGVQGVGVPEGSQNLVHLLGRLRLRPITPTIYEKKGILMQDEK